MPGYQHIIYDVSILYELMGQVTFECSWVNDYERSLILRLFSNMSQWVELGSIMIGWYGHKNRLYLLVHFTNALQ